LQPNSTTRWRKDLGENPLEIVVVFDGSSDCTVEEVCKFTEAGLRLIEITEYNGKNFAMNIALKSIDYDVVVFSDANSELQSKALCYLMRQQTGAAGQRHSS
jgi:cellulose synthase/poly-beta-1,6-N-acetylglucosamine synthase-like glycosyltransferase